MVGLHEEEWLLDWQLYCTLGITRVIPTAAKLEPRVVTIDTRGNLADIVIFVRCVVVMLVFKRH